MPICDCGQNFENESLLNDHQRNCNNNYLLCELCEEYVPSTTMAYHLFHCGSKTNRCPKCSRYIRRSIYHYHLDNNCIDLNEDLESDGDDENSIPCEFCERHIKFASYETHTKSCAQKEAFQLPQSIIDHRTYENAPTTEKKSPRTDVLSHLQEKTSAVHRTLSTKFYPAELDHVTAKLQFNILVMGSPRVGKSQLINALCGKEVAETSPSLNSCTKDVQCCVLEDNQTENPGIKPFRVHFYDTPGIESWINQNGQEVILKLLEEKDPICLIYCASPGSFADLNQLRPVLELCQKKHIFCALVCTNMWSGPGRHDVMREFQQELAIFGERTVKSFDQDDHRRTHEVILFGKNALCTMVNSKEYVDPDLSSEKRPVQGIDELIYCIMESLDDEKLLGWCYAVLCRRTFWEKMTQKVNGFCSSRFSSLSQFTSDELISNLSKFFKKEI